MVLLLKKTRLECAHAATAVGRKVRQLWRQFHQQLLRMHCSKTVLCEAMNENLSRFKS